MTPGTSRSSQTSTNPVSWAIGCLNQPWNVAGPRRLSGARGRPQNDAEGSRFRRKSARGSARGLSVILPDVTGHLNGVSDQSRSAVRRGYFGAPLAHQTTGQEHL
jgi:hypothetical protein